MHAVLDCETWAAYWPCANSRHKSVTIRPSLARVYNMGVVTSPPSPLSINGVWKETSAYGRCEKYGAGELTPALRAVIDLARGMERQHGGGYNNPKSI